MRSLHFFILIILTLFYLNSCQTTESELVLAIETTDFDSSLTTVQIQKLSPAAQLQYFEKLIQSNNQKKDEIDQWISDRLLPLRKQLDLVKVQDVHRFILLSESENFTKSSLVLSQYIFNNRLESKYFPLVPIAAHTIANEYLLKNQTDSIEFILQEMKNYLEYDTNYVAPVAYYFTLGEHLAQEGKYFEAVVNYNNALENTTVQDSTNQIVILQSLAIMYLKMDYYDKAKTYLDTLTSLLGGEFYPAKHLINIAIIKSKTGDMEGAERALYKALENSEKQQSLVEKAKVLSNLGNLKRRQKNYEEGLQFMQTSDSICAALGLDIGILINQINRAELFYDQKAFLKAKETLTQAKTQILNLDNPKINKEFYNLMYKVNDSLGNTADANFYFRRFIENKEHFIGDLPRSIIAEWELEKKTNLYTQKNNALNLQIQKQEKNKYIILFILSIVIITFILFYFIRNKKHILSREKLKFVNQKISYELELKSKELLADSLKNITVQQLKEEIKEDLKLVVKDLPKTYHQRFTELYKKLQVRTSKFYLDEFETRFTQVYEDFYVKIKQIAPDLTPNELRICALMRLNISTKEIAMITNRTIGTVDNTRSAIRKKLQLQDQVNLQEYLIDL